VNRYHGDEKTSKKAFCMLKAIGISKKYAEANQLTVLKGIDLEVAEGEIISIVGASGAGKSTLLHILGTLDRADEGTVEIKGIRLETLSAAQLASFRNKYIGFVFQFHHLLPEFTALENVCIPALIAGKSRASIESRAKELLDSLNLSHRFSHKPGMLSGGEQQRVAVARALINNPAIILADEPSGNLDSESAQMLHELFFTLRNQFNQTFIIATHNTELANKADRKLSIRDGKILNEQKI